MTTTRAIDRHIEQTKQLQVLRGQRCPDCDSTRTESNGHTEYRCIECDHRWGQEERGADWYGI